MAGSPTALKNHAKLPHRHWRHPHHCHPHRRPGVPRHRPLIQPIVMWHGKIPKILEKCQKNLL